MHPSPLPVGLPAAFTVATALAHGVTRKRVRAQDLARPFHGTRSRGPLADIERLRLLLDVLPAHAFFCGPTAALVWGLPLPSTLEVDARTHPHVGVPRGETRVRRAGTAGHRLDIAEHDIVQVGGIATLSPARTWVDLSRCLHLPRLLAVTDALLGRRHPLASRDELAEAHLRFSGGRGARTRERALELAEEGAESPRESMLRLLLIEAGLPTPECNVEIRDGWRFIARVDLLYRDARVIIEYDGDHHRDPDQWSRDQIRRAELESLGYRYITVTRRDFDDPVALVRRVRRSLAAAS